MKSPTIVPRWSAILAAAAVSLVACSIVVDTSDLSGATASPDGSFGPDGGDVAASDAASSDGSFEASASACPGHPNALICDTFDDGPLGARWTSTSTAGGNLTLSNAQASSKPWSLLSEILADSGTSGAGSAGLLLDVPRTFPVVQTAYDIYFDKLGNRAAVIGSIYRRDGLRAYNVSLIARGNGAMEVIEEGVFPDGGVLSTSHPFSSIPLGVWTRVIMAVDFGASPTATLTLQVPPGSPATPVLDHVPITPTVAGLTTRVYAGIDYVLEPESLGWRVYVDNVVIEPL